MSIPLVSGGLVDQPHIWLLEYAVVEQEKTMFEALAAQNQQARQDQSKSGG